MSRFFWSLRFRLKLVVFLSILPAIALILYSGFEERRNAAAQAQMNSRQLIELASMHQARVIEEARRLLPTFSELLLQHDGNLEHCSSSLAEILKNHPKYLNFGIIGVDGQVLCSALPFESGLNLSDASYFRNAIDYHRFSIGSSQMDRITGKTSINFGYPLCDQEGTVRGVAFAAVDLAWLSELAAHAKLPPGATFTVIDSKGGILSRYPEPNRWVGKVIPDTGILRAVLEQGAEGIAEANGLDGVRRLYSFTPLDDYPHSTFLYTGIPTKDVYAGANRAFARNLFIMGLVFVLALLSAHVFGHFFVMRSVDTLVRTVGQFAKGDMDARTGLGHGKGELNQLGMVFDLMAQSIQRRGIERDQMEEALRRSEAKYRTLVEQIPVVTYTAALDEAHTTLYISPQIETLLGFDTDDFAKDPRTWCNRLHPEDRERVLEAISRCLEDRDFFVCEYRMLTFNGYVKWIRDEAVLVTDERDTPLFMQGILIDITEQKKAEAALRKAHDELELRVEERTRELAKANEDLRQETEKLKFFAYSVVHDLKSPAIGAYGLTRLLHKQFENVLDEKARHYCDQIMKASEHIADLVEKINAFIATKESPLRIETLQLREVLGALKDEFSPKIDQRNIQWYEPGSEVELRADRLSVLRVLRNLVDNALKYGGEQLSEIRIGHREENGFHVLYVSDDGKGVSEGSAEKIFKAFQRNGSSNGIEGAGLGLAIVKEVADRHRGKAWMEQNQKKGTTFYLAINKDLQPGEHHA